MKKYFENSAYWEYEGKPALLLGASDEDNPFQWTGEILTTHLDLLVSVGGNYIRNVMSDRDPGNVYAFKKAEDGRYDLNTWNEEYGERLKVFLDETAKRKIIVHLTLWDQYDIRAKGYDMKGTCPWNPKSNINYCSTDTINTWEDLFYTAEKENEEVLQYQRRFVARILEISLDYDHIIYNICNENFTSQKWDKYWAKVIRETAEAKGVKAQITAMQMDAEATVRLAVENPELFTFADISQNNEDALGTGGKDHMNTILRLRQILAAAGMMPMNNIKIYGSENGVPEAGSGIEAVHRFWRNIFGGCASMRFHRPSWGLGLTEDAQQTIKAARKFSQEFEIFTSSPLPELVSPVTAKQAYCIGRPGAEYAVYLPEGGSAVLDPFVYTDEVEVRWFDVKNCTLSDPEVHAVQWTGYAGMMKTQKTKGGILLTAPTTDMFCYRNQWIALVKVRRNENSK